MQCPNRKCGSEDSKVMETRKSYLDEDDNWVSVKLRKRQCSHCKEYFITQESTLLNYEKYHIFEFN